MSHLKRGKSRSMRHKKNKKSRNNKRSLRHTKKNRRNNTMKSIRSMKRRHYNKSKKYNKLKYARQNYNGGYHYVNHKGKSFRGGTGLRSLLPMELVNLGDSIRTGISTIAHDAVGSVYSPPSSMPNQGHAIDNDVKYVLPKVADINKIYTEASTKVSNLYT